MTCGAYYYLMSNPLVGPSNFRCLLASHANSHIVLAFLYFINCVTLMSSKHDTTESASAYEAILPPIAGALVPRLIN